MTCAFNQLACLYVHKLSNQSLSK